MLWFSSTSDATSYIYASEIFPTPLRAKGLAVSVSGLFVATIIFLQVAPTAFAAIGWKYYLVFLFLTTVIGIFIYFCYPEVILTPHSLCCLDTNHCFSSQTNQLSLEQIGELFGDKVERANIDEKTDDARSTNVEDVSTFTTEAGIKV
jgi:MFS family permease